ncbi:MAG: family 20 glycosylhydrolase [Candidatus Nanopelagicales bacterium]
MSTHDESRSGRHQTGPHTWPPRDLHPTGLSTLDRPVTVDGPWTEQVRFALPMLDPLPATGTQVTGSLHVTTRTDQSLPDEGYRLEISTAEVTITASSPEGALQATTTIRQLLPAEAWRATATRRDDWTLPILRITDVPACTHRGVMLDVSRHFAPVPEVLRWIELAAMHRLNRLHLHLTDDQGWRLPSHAYPALAEVASWRTASWVGHSRGIEAEDPTRLDGTPHGGHYSFADLREISAHAARHGITIIPEVDLPGHACALLAAIPELAVPGTPPQQVATRWGLLGRTISPLPAAMAIIETLLGEVADALPSPYLHIGGDEADLTMWRASDEVRRHAEQHGGIEALRGAVNAQLATMVLTLGRTPIAWDDAYAAGGLPTEAIVMPWRSTALGLHAAAAGHDVIMAPVMPTYFDYAEAAGPDEPLSIGAPLTLADVAAWTPPVPALGSPGRVLGGQAQLWAEYTPDAGAREYRAFPRLSVLAANLWSGTPTDLDAHAPALSAQLERLAVRHVNARPPAGPHPWQRGGTGRRSPAGAYPMAEVLTYLDQAAMQAEPPAM